MTRTARSMVIVLAASVALSSAGCASRSGNGTLVGVGAVVATVGLALYASDTAMEPREDDPYADDLDLDLDLDLTARFGKGLIGLGLAMAAGGVIGLMQSSPETTAEDVAERDAATVAAQLSEADRLAMRAVHAAAAGDCAAVRLNVAMIQSTDRDYASALVAHDAQIAACVGR